VPGTIGGIISEDGGVEERTVGGGGPWGRGGRGHRPHPLGITAVDGQAKNKNKNQGDRQGMQATVNG